MNATYEGKWETARLHLYLSALSQIRPVQVTVSKKYINCLVVVVVVETFCLQRYLENA